MERGHERVGGEREWRNWEEGRERRKETMVGEEEGQRTTKTELEEKETTLNAKNIYTSTYIHIHIHTHTHTHTHIHLDATI